MDSVGIGELPDAAAYGDQGSNTVGNIHRQVPLAVPTLRSLGLGRLVDIGGDGAPPLGVCGRMAEASPGKDSVTGHWEMMGVVLERPFPTFPKGFPQDLITEFEARIGRRSLGNVVASGTAIIDELGPAHLSTGQPIVYTSADSVFQIAAHEQIIGLDELYRICGIAFELASVGLGVGRVIARPFVGSPGNFQRTANRRDFALEPFGDTLLDRLREANLPVVGIGKIEDLFAGRGVSKSTHTISDDHGMDVLEAELGETGEGLIAINLVDFDSQYGHRNDVAGYAANLERFDARLARLLPMLTPADLLVVTADHGNDPTTPSTDHSREHVPLLIHGRMLKAGTDLGTRASYSDLGQSLTEFFDIQALDHGRSFMRRILK